MKVTAAGYKEGFGSRLFDAGIYLFLIMLIFVCIYPFLYVFSVSISDSTSVAAGRVKFYPIGFETYAYKIILSSSSILRAYANTILYAVSATFLTLFLTCITAYPLSIKRFYGRNVITIFFTITMFFNGGLIPSFLLIRSLGMMDTIWAIIVPGALAMWNIIIIRTNFQGLPEELRESAYIDGAGNWKILSKIVVPLSKPILATIGLFTLVAQWNSFFVPLLYLTSPEKYPLQIVLRHLIIIGQMRGEFTESAVVISTIGHLKNYNMLGYYESLKMAAIIVSIGPIILVYPFLQKYFVKGVLVGSVKG